VLSTFLLICQSNLDAFALVIIMGREQGTGNREQGAGSSE